MYVCMYVCLYVSVCLYVYIYIYIYKLFAMPPFLRAEGLKKSAGGLQSTVSPPVGPRQSPGGIPRGEVPGSSKYLGFENLLL